MTPPKGCDANKRFVREEVRPLQAVSRLEPWRTPSTLAHRTISVRWAGLPLASHGLLGQWPELTRARQPPKTRHRPAAPLQ